MSRSLREIITKIVSDSQGIKGAELALKIVGETIPYNIPVNDILLTLNRMVEEDELVELEYILPNMDWRFKSIYFPKGTKFENTK